MCVGPRNLSVIPTRIPQRDSRLPQRARNDNGAGLKPGPTFKTAGQRPALQVTSYDPFRGAALRGSPAPGDSAR